MTELRWPHLPHPRDVGGIVEGQVRRWALNKQSKPREALLAEWPVITISREYGTQGTALGRRVAERLGFSCWDSEIVTEIAHLLHTDEATISAFDERTRGAIEDLIGTSLFNQDVISADYADNVRRTIDSIARRGRAVIVGRGAQFLVDPNHALRVRLVAPFEHRAREIATLKGISFEQAQQTVESSDKERAAYVHHATGKYVAEPAQYDVVINTKSYAGERADALVLMAYLSKFGELPVAEHTRELEVQPLANSSRLAATPVGDG
jgi:cytidylate kinase